MSSCLLHHDRANVVLRTYGISHDRSSVSITRPGWSHYTVFVTYNPCNSPPHDSPTQLLTQIYGNKFYETDHQDEIHLRTRYVEYKEKDYDMSQVEPGWHFWLGYGVDTAPCNTPKEKLPIRAYPYKFQPNYTGTPGAFVTYNTLKPKISAWEPVTKQRS